MKLILVFFLSSLLFSVSGFAENPGLRQTPPFETCFSPEGNCNEKLVAAIMSAKATVEVAIYDLNQPDILNALLNRKQNGVVVRVVCDERQSKTPHSAISMLSHKIPVRFGKQRGIMHDKFTIIDSQLLETGSYNYTTHATFSNQENQIYLTDTPTINVYRNKFETMWSLAKPLPGKH